MSNAFYDQVSGSQPLLWWRLHSTAGGTTVTASPHRYWRVYWVAATNNTGPSCAELAFHSTVGGANLCTGGAAMSSSQYNSSYPGTNAFDGNASTIWAGVNTGDNAGSWLGYDLGAGVSASVLEVVFTPRPDVGYADQSPSVAHVQWSDDGLAWTTYWDFTASGWTAGVAKTFVGTTTPPYFADFGVSGTYTGTFTAVTAANYTLSTASVTYHPVLGSGALYISGSTATWNVSTGRLHAFDFINPWDTASNSSSQGWTFETVVKWVDRNNMNNSMCLFNWGGQSVDGYSDSISIAAEANGTVFACEQMTMYYYFYSGSQSWTWYQYFPLNPTCLFDLHDGQWHHIAFVSINNTPTGGAVSWLFIDGKAKIRQSTGGNYSGADARANWYRQYPSGTRVSTGNTNYNNPTVFYMGEFMLYNRPLLGSELLAHYHALQAPLTGGFIWPPTGSTPTIYSVQIGARNNITVSSGSGGSSDPRGSKTNTGVN